ncbi:MAG TPA: cytochrome c3 family protein [Nitrospiria bacterium]|nr:cytochrome c3 family protein [Nitrospiria bacterium]
MRFAQLGSLALVIGFCIGLLTFSPGDARAAEIPTSKDCLICHGNPDLKREAPAPGRPESLFIDESGMKASVHGRVECVTCHMGVAAPHEKLISPIPGVDLCASCHSQEVEAYQGSNHARSRQHADSEAATCSSCHGDVHAILAKTDPRSPSYHLNLPRTCAKCHANPELARRYNLRGGNVYQLYMDSIHGRAITQSGLLVSANCSSCHGAHDIRSSEDPASRIHKANIPQTCGSCHAGVLTVYRESVHGRQFSAGLFSAPVCTDCHTAHEIQRVEQEAWKLEIVRECGTCHSESLRTFRDTFHGQVTSLGFTRVARCSDCHGAHEIQPSRDPRSRIHPANLVSTCQKCHATANLNFVKYDPHADPDNRERNPVLYYAAWFMTLLLVGVFVFFGLHTLLWGVRTMVGKWSGELPRSHPKESGSYYFRFSAGQRLLHGILIVGFLGLVATGMPLLYSQTDWAIWLAHTVGGFGVMGFLHRIFAIVLSLLFVYHVSDILYRVVMKKEWGLLWGPNSLVPQPRDIANLYRNFLWFFGLGLRPRFGRFTYWEKFDYFAVFWGMPVIGITGYILWFAEFFARFLPGWWFNIAQLVHGEEALLAAGFIFTIHYFNTHLRPEKFPMDLVIFTGRVSEAELREERPEEYHHLLEEKSLDSIKADPPPVWLRNLGWIVGATAVAIGLLLLALILIAIFWRK